MSEILVKDKDIVVPGDVLADGMDFLPSHGTYRLDSKIYSSIVGLVHIDRKVIKLIPLVGGYMPKKGDVVIGEIVDILMSGWRVELGCAYQAMLPLQEASTDYIEKHARLDQYFDFGDIICTKITNVSTQKLVDVSMKGPGLKKLYGGRIMKISPYKVPRVIGKQGSMVGLLKKETGSFVMVGQNGLAWVKNDDVRKETITLEAIKLVNENSHVSGLTEKVKEFLTKRLAEVQK